jgi:protoporphyrinogen oxidase
MVNTIIIGGGIAGLTIAEQLAKRGETPLLLEKYPHFGGRIATYREKDLQYEIGAGRINTQHERVNTLVKRFDLHTYPISTDSLFEHEPNPFQELFQPIRTVLSTAHTLGSTTIAEMIPDEFRSILTMYPYWAEMNLMRADRALTEFLPDHNMGIKAKYYGIKEGLDTLTTKLASAAKDAGADLRNSYRVHDIRRIGETLFEITGDYGKKADAKPFRIQAHRVIIATCRCSLSNFSVLKKLPLLTQLQTSSLIRIYAVYPKNADGKVWFHDLPKTVTASKLRHVIPINPTSGLIMISYTDGDDTKYWHTLEGTELQAAIQKEVKQLFPAKTIPEPTYLKKHDWPSGCTYWVPGDYDVETASRDAHNPSNNLYVCGESVSTEQAWIEGALQSAETLMKLL